MLLVEEGRGGGGGGGGDGGGADIGKGITLDAEAGDECGGRGGVGAIDCGEEGDGGKQGGFPSVSTNDC